MNAQESINNGPAGPKRALAAAADTFAHVGGQIICIALEAIAWVLGKSAYREGTRAARRAAHGYWMARALARRGKLHEAFDTAKGAYAGLTGADRDATFAETAMLVMLLDKLARQIGIPGAVHAELADAFEVLRPIHADPERRSASLQQLMNWLAHRIDATKPD